MTLVERLDRVADELHLPPSIQSQRNIRVINAATEAAARIAALEARVDELVGALEWFGTQRNCGLDFDGKAYCDDDEPDLWRISRWTGPINDRECETVCYGKTPLEAIITARTLIERPTHD